MVWGFNWHDVVWQRQTVAMCSNIYAGKPATLIREDIELYCIDRRRGSECYRQYASTMCSSWQERFNPSVTWNHQVKALTPAIAQPRYRSCAKMFE